MRKFIIVSPKTGKPVQNWTFAGKKHILYCQTPEWAMKHENEEDANKTLEYLKKEFPDQVLVVMPVTIETIFKVG